MVVKLCFSLLIPLSIGFVLLHAFLPFKKMNLTQLSLIISLSVGLGFGIASCIYFLCLFLFGATMTAAIVSEVAMLILLIFIFIYRDKARISSENDILFEKKMPGSKMQHFFLYSFYFVLFSAFSNFVALEIHTPHGAWDAWAIWNLRARFIFRGGVYWFDAFSNLLSTFQHPDYPLLVPLTVVRSWTYIGKETQAAPIVIAFLFLFATVGIIYSTLAVLRSRNQGFLASIFLLSTTIFIFLGTYQYADVPLGFFFLASIVFLFFQERFPDNYNFSLFAGSMAGLSGWTKNEGILFLVAIILARLIVTSFVHYRKAYLKQLMYLVLGCMPFVVLIIYFKVNLAPHNDIVTREVLMRGAMGKLCDYPRYVEILKAFILRITINFPHILFLIVCFPLFGISIDNKIKISVITSSLVLVFMLLGYFLVYQITPYDLQWHLEKSLPRLFAQLWPSVLMTYFMIIRTPEDVLNCQESTTKL